MNDVNTLVRIVDDDITILESLSMILSYEGFQVKTWNNALDFLRDDRPSVAGCLILDIKMPGITGLELQAELNNRGPHLPIIFLTGHADVEIAVQAMRVGAFDFIQKPFKPESLIGIVQKAIDKDLINRGLIYDPVEALHLWNELTEREKELVKLVSSGLVSQQIASRLNISRRTVENHRANIYKTLRINSVSQLTALLHALPINESEVSDLELSPTRIRAS